MSASSVCGGPPGWLTGDTNGGESWLLQFQLLDSIAAAVAAVSLSFCELWPLCAFMPPPHTPDKQLHDADSQGRWRRHATIRHSSTWVGAAKQQRHEAGGKAWVLQADPRLCSIRIDQLAQQLTTAPVSCVHKWE